MNSPLWLNFLCFAMLVIMGIWLFLGGYLNIKTGRGTKFGLDYFFHVIDKWLKNKKGHWNDPRRIRISGFITILFALAVTISSLTIFVRFILPRIK